MLRKFKGKAEFNKENILIRTRHHYTFHHLSKLLSQMKNRRKERRRTSIFTEGILISNGLDDENLMNLELVLEEDESSGSDDDENKNESRVRIKFEIKF